MNRLFKYVVLLFVLIFLSTIHIPKWEITYGVLMRDEKARYSICDTSLYACLVLITHCGIFQNQMDEFKTSMFTYISPT